MFFKIDFIKIFAKFTDRRQCWSLLMIMMKEIDTGTDIFLWILRDILEHLLYKKEQGCFWVCGNHFWLTMKRLTQRLSVTEVGQPRILQTLTLNGLTKVSRILVSTNTRLQFINWARLIFANKKIQSKGQSF